MTMKKWGWLLSVLLLGLMGCGGYRNIPEELTDDAEYFFHSHVFDDHAVVTVVRNKKSGTYFACFAPVGSGGDRYCGTLTLRGESE